MKWCPAIVVPSIRIRTLLDNHPSNIEETIWRRNVQWDPAIKVPNILADTVREQQLADFDMSPMQRYMDWSPIRASPGDRVLWALQEEPLCQAGESELRHVV